MWARTLFLAAPLFVIFWSFSAGVRAMHARQEAQDADQGWRVQAGRMESAKKMWERRHETWLAAQAAAAAQGSGPLEAPSAVRRGAPASLEPQVVGAAVVGKGAPADRTKAALAQGSRLVSRLRQSLARCRVRLEEARMGPAHDLGGQKGRRLRLILVGRPGAIKKAVGLLKSEPQLLEVAEPSLERSKQKGVARTTVTGTMRLVEAHTRTS
ncbi:MAG: hypothetical protein HY815_17295 [Candidatus Riflebacteria bacterium]|nr:hypothetical protein [Candidatus Riflebacteria bacterium]